MNKKNICSFVVCTSLVISSAAPIMVVSAEGNEEVQNGESQYNDTLINEQVTGISTSESLLDTDSSSVGTEAAEEETTQSETIEETTETTEEEVSDPDAYTEPAPSSRSDLSVASRSLARSAIDTVTAGEANRPKVSFIDVSSHNGTITTSQYQMMKTYGVKGVVVKLTEGTTYFNTFAQSQIANAKAAGLKVSVYHYSHYTTAAGAQAEANYFASKAASLSLSKDTVMVNDIEEGTMNISSLNSNTMSFKQRLNSLGYNNVAYYMSRSWLDVAGGNFQTATFGKGNIWVAQYPYTPTASQNWNSDYSSWQWSSNFFFPGISHAFDMNTDYTGLFTEESTDKWDPSIPVTGTTSIADATGTETTFRATATVSAGGYVPYKVYFPTWSINGGQDDIVWYEGKLNSDGTWTADIDISKHKTVGNYTSHVYVQMLASSSNIFIGSNDFVISPVTMDAQIVNYDKSKGTFDVITTGTSVSGIKQVRLPVWSKENQSDLYWYDAVRQSDGSYKATVNIKNHSYNTGTYTIHSYLYGNNGLSAAKALSQKVEASEVTSSTTITDTKKTETTYTLTADVATGVYGTLKEVSFAVWSSQGGQDDIRWYVASKQSNGKYTATVNINNHKTAGEYVVHTYIKLPNGTSKFMSNDRFTVAAPTASVTSTDFNKTKGTFDVTVNVSAPAGVKEVNVPVWSKSNQSDIKWYKGIKQSNGTYKVTVDVKNHQYNAGNYKVHVYIQTNNSLSGFTSISNGVTVALPAITGSIKVTPNSTETTYNAVLTVDMGMYGAAKQILLPVWSDKNGQDDIKWYVGKRNSDGTYSAPITISNHKDAGKYNLHVYAQLSNGTNKYVTATTFNVTAPTATVSTGAFNKSAGTFTVTVKGSSKSGFSKILVPVWSKSNQSDMKWYEAVRQSDGTYKVTVNIKNHGNNKGKYNVHTYLYAANGVTGFAAAAPVTVS
ncbi:GBS Bsp-like repeat-containing protein [Enterococcus larvae]|uniref:GBS Bsp-like repeat-containing protein n=1 Tax=Enterococcus larvae TaxID=2794352 RepID=UPI003F34D28F